MSDRSGRPETDDIGELEQRLRTALTEEADAYRPAGRLAEIRAAVRPSSVRRRSWVQPIAVAATVAAVAVAAWLGLRPTTTQTTPSAPAPTSPVATPGPTPTQTLTPSPAPTTDSGTATGTATTTSPGPLVPVALPVYVVAPPPRPGTRYGLVRVFVSTKLPADATMQDKANAALATALTLPLEPNPNRYVRAWPQGTNATWVDLPAPQIGVQLSNPGVTGLPKEAQQLSVQALVWTVTAVAKQADAPVQVTVGTGGNLFEQVPSNVFKRPAADQAYLEIAPIWVDSPSPGQALPASAPVVVTGQACAFEANVLWELRQGSTVVKSGFTTASSGCPTQGSWTVNLGKLAPGAYEVRVSESLGQPGTPATNVVPFSVG